MASSVSFNGITTSVPGVFLSEDVSALSGTSLGATGIVALIGSATGGVPYTALSGRSDIRSYGSATALARAFPAGDLLEAANLTFAASQDQAIAGGAQFVVPLKANPATQASVTLAGSGGPSISLTAQAWGLAGNTITAAVAAGSQSGVKLTLSQGNITETADNLGNQPVASLSFKAQSGGWQTMQAGIAAGSLTAQGTAGLQGKSSDLLTSTLASPSTVAITANAGDVGKALTLYGLTAAGVAQSEVVTLVAGAQASSKTYGRLLGASLSSPAQDVKLADAAGNTLVELDNNETSAGLFSATGLGLAGGPVAVHGSAAGEKVVLVGLDSSGNPVLQAFTLATTDQASPALASVQAVALGGVDPTHTVTLSAQVVSLPGSAGTTVGMAAGAFAGVPGFTFNVVRADAATPLSQLDSQAPVDIVAGKLQMVSDIRAAVDWAAQNSQLVTIAAAPGSVGMPVPTVAPVFLTGGGERPASAADYQACLNLLKQVRVNTVVALTGDPAVAKAVDAHCALMCGAGQSERDAVVGVMNGAISDVPSFAELTAAAGKLNSRHTRAVGQAVSVYDSHNVLVEVPPPFLAAMVAGMQASAGVGVPLTHKTVDVLSIRQSTSWSPMDDAQELLDAGCCIFEQKDNIGIRMVRNLTTYTAAENLAFQEASVNQIIDYVAYNTRMALEQFVGQRGFSGTVNAVSAKTSALMQELIAQTIIVSFQPPTVTIVGDVMNVAISIAPVIPTNFILCSLAFSLPSALSNSSQAA